MNAPTIRPLSKAVAPNADVLRIIRDDPGGEFTPKRLADAAGRDGSNIMKGLDVLEREDVIRREEIGKGRFRLWLTGVGAQVLAGIDMAEGRSAPPLAGGAASPAALPYDAFRPSPDNPRRKARTDEQIDELADSVATKGVLQPILVKPPGDDGVREIIAGEGRWLGVKRLAERGDDAPAIPFLERDEDKAEALLTALIENTVRQDMDRVDEGAGYILLCEYKGWSGRELARRLPHLNYKTAADRMKVAREATPEAIAAFRRGELTWKQLLESVQSLSAKMLLALVELADAAARNQGLARVNLDALQGALPELVSRGLAATNGRVDTLSRIRTGWYRPTDKGLGALDEEELRPTAETRLEVLRRARVPVLGEGMAADLERLDAYAARFLNFPPAAAPDGPAPAQATSPYKPQPASNSYLAGIGHPLPAEGFREPTGPDISELVRPGTIVRTNYGSGPYVVIELRPHRSQGGVSWSIAMCSPRDFERRAAPTANAWINDVVAVDGRLLQLFANNDDEVLIEGHSAEYARRLGAEPLTGDHDEDETADEAPPAADGDDGEASEGAPGGDGAAGGQAEAGAPLVSLSPRERLALIELAHKIQGEGVTWNGQGIGAELGPHWQDEALLELVQNPAKGRMVRLWAAPLGGWYGFLTEAGEAWVRAWSKGQPVGVSLLEGAYIANGVPQAEIAALLKGARYLSPGLNPAAAPASIAAAFTPPPAAEIPPDAEAQPEDAGPEILLVLRAGDLVHKGTSVTSYRLLERAYDQPALTMAGMLTPVFKVQTLRNGRDYGTPVTLRLSEIIGLAGGDGRP